MIVHVDSQPSLAHINVWWCGHSELVLFVVVANELTETSANRPS